MPTDGAGATGRGAERVRFAVRPEEETPMADKSPKKPNAKKPGKSLKEKRAAKHAKHDESRTGLGR